MTCETIREFDIIQGEDITIPLQLMKKNSRRFFDLTTATQITARFKKTDGTYLEKNLSTGVVIISAPEGRITVALTDSDTNLLLIGLLQSFDVRIDFGSITRKARAAQKLNVEPSDP